LLSNFWGGIILEMKTKFHKGKGKNQRFLGVEIEISGFNHRWEGEIRKVVKKWGGECKEDGSIDPDSSDSSADTTMEITTAPASGDRFRKQIKEICRVLKKAKATANDSCGLHVHIDARDFEPNDIVKAEIVWGKVQRQMYKKVASYRRMSEFCTPRYHTDDLVRNLKANLSQGSLNYFSNLTDEGRYYSLNFDALDKFGTLENRQKEGTVDANEIIKWAELNARIIDYIKEIPFKKALTLNRLSVKRFE
jgi:hypothetical protein